MYCHTLAQTACHSGVCVQAVAQSVPILFLKIDTSYTLASCLGSFLRCTLAPWCVSVRRSFFERARRSTQLSAPAVNSSSASSTPAAAKRSLVSFPPSGAPGWGQRGAWRAHRRGPPQTGPRGHIVGTIPTHWWRRGKTGRAEHEHPRSGAGKLWTVLG